MPAQLDALDDSHRPRIRRGLRPRLRRGLVRARPGEPDRRAHRLQRGLRAAVRDRRTDRGRRRPPRRRPAGAGVGAVPRQDPHLRWPRSAPGPCRAGRRTRPGSRGRSAWPAGQRRRPGRAARPLHQLRRADRVGAVVVGGARVRGRRWRCTTCTGSGRAGPSSPSPASARRTRWSARRPGSWTSSRRCSASTARPCSSTAGPCAGENVPLPLDAAGLAIVLADTRRAARARGGRVRRPPGVLRPGRAASSASGRCATSASATSGRRRAARPRDVPAGPARGHRGRARARDRRGAARRAARIGPRRPRRPSHRVARVDAGRLRDHHPRPRPRRRHAPSAGALGARMTGGGFGGATIALIDAERVPALAAAIIEAFSWAGLAAPRISRVTPGPGARRVRAGSGLTGENALGDDVLVPEAAEGEREQDHRVGRRHDGSLDHGVP